MINMNNPVAMAQEIAQLRAINDDLLAALKAIAENGCTRWQGVQGYRQTLTEIVNTARAAIAKAEKTS